MKPDDVHEAVSNGDLSELRKTSDRYTIELFLYSMFGAISNGIVELEYNDLQLAIDKVRPFDPVKANHHQADLIYSYDYASGDDVPEETKQKLIECLVAGAKNGCSSLYYLVEPSGIFDYIFEGVDLGKTCNCFDEPQKLPE